MMASPPIHITAPPACRSAIGAGAQAGRGPVGRPGVPAPPYPSTRPVNVSTGMIRTRMMNRIG